MLAIARCKQILEWGFQNKSDFTKKRWSQMDGSWFHYFNGTPLHTSTVYVCWGCCTWWTTPTHAGPCCRSYKSVKEGNLMVSRAWDLVCMSPKNRSHVVPGVPVIEFKVALLVAVVLQRQGHVLLENPQQSLALSLRTCFWELTNHKLCVLLLPIPPSPRSSTTHGCGRSFAPGASLSSWPGWECLVGKPGSQ